MKIDTKDEIIAWVVACASIYFIFRVIIMGGD